MVTTMGKKINIRPTTGVYATYKNIKYDPWTAIAEFVDNSTQSYYDHKTELRATENWDRLNVEIVYEKNSSTGDCLVIRDNAYGMNFADFQRAIVLDSPPKIASRSEFGMGLKTAACWFGTNWSVESTELGANVKYYATVDVDALHKFKNEEIEVQETECDPAEHGTTITIWNLNRQIVGKQIKKTKDQLRGMYRVDLRSQKISISYNGENLQFEEPAILTEKLPDGSKKEWKEKIDFSIPYKNRELTVKGFIAIRETASTSGAGFALIRRGRVIIGGYENAYRPEEIFEKPNSFVYQRLFGELRMDNWPVTQTKDAFDWYNGLEDQLIERLNEVCRDYKKKAKEYRVGKKTSHDESVSTLVNTFEQAGVIQKPRVKSIKEKPGEQSNGENQGQTMAPLETNSNQPKVETTGQNKDIIIEGATGKQISFRTKSGKYVFNLFLKKDDQHKNWLFVTPVESKENEYNIEWNIRHPFFKPFIDEPEFLQVMEKFVFALALSEIESLKSSVDGQVESSAIRMRMNDILKDVANGGSAQ